MRGRIAVSLVIGLCSGAFCWFLLTHLQLGAADFNWTFDAARDLFARSNPFSRVPSGTIPYPIPAVLFAMPFAVFPRTAAAGLFFGVSSGLLAFGLTRHGYTRLLIFLAYPYWAALLVVQWTPLISAVGGYAGSNVCAACRPACLDNLLVKVHAGDARRHRECAGP